MKIAIDGPAGAGKTTIGKALAQRFELRFINTGAMYRAVAWALQHGFSPEKIQISLDEQGQIVVDGRTLGEAELYTRELDQLASEVACRPEVRRRLIELQQQIAQQGDVVMEGRDIGTVVMPDAEVKLFITASLEERAKRRVHERPDASYKQVLKELEERDERDRGFGRLVPAPEAIILCTDGKSPEESIAEAIHLIEQALRN
jgi:cytidylate kinase